MQNFRYIPFSRFASNPTPSIQQPHLTYDHIIHAESVNLYWVTVKTDLTLVVEEELM